MKYDEFYKIEKIKEGYIFYTQRYNFYFFWFNEFQKEELEKLDIALSGYISKKQDVENKDRRILMERIAVIEYKITPERITNSYYAKHKVKYEDYSKDIYDSMSDRVKNIKAEFYED